MNAIFHRRDYSRRPALQSGTARAGGYHPQALDFQYPPPFLRTTTMKMPTLALVSCCLLALAAGSTIAATPAAAGAPASAAAKAATTETLPSGVVVAHTRAGQGNSPAAADTVQVHYRGKLADGTEFDSSYKRGKPTSFPLNGVIPCWTEGLQKMKVGGVATLTCPPATAYGPRGAAGVIPPNATLTFEVELLSVTKQ
jgi:FKBP-type peptidyl-prolyl cis-trans isomerase FkpA